MRKFTSLMLMLLCAVTTAWAQTDLPEITTDLNNPVYYTIYNTRSQEPGGFMYYAGDGVGIKDGCTSAVLEDKYKFYFTGSHDALYIHNAATTNKLAAVGSWTTEGTVWCVKQREDGNLAFGPQGAGDDEQKWWNDKNFATDAAVSDFTVWTSYDAGSGFVVELASEFTYPEVGKFYTIEAPLFEKVQGVAKGLVANGGNALGWNTVDLANKNYYWTLVKDAETNALYLKNVGTGYYINGDAVRKEAAALTTNALGSNQFNIITNSVKLHASGHNSGNGANGGVLNWNGAANSASAWKFVEREDPNAVTTLDITYNFTYNGKALEGYTQTKTVLVGQEYPNITVSFPFGVKATKPAGIVAADAATTVTIAVEENLPFACAASYDAVANWYYVKNKGEFYLSHVDGQNYIALGNEQKTVDAGNKDAFTWAFVGNPFDGFQLVNKAAGKGMVLSSSTTIDGDGANTFPVMTVSPVNKGNNELWVVTASGHQENGFFIAQKGFVSNRMNNRGDKLAYWTGGADNGSTFTVELRNDEEELLAALAEAQELVNSITGEGVGYATSASIKAVQDAIDAKDLVALQYAIANIKTIQPEEGKFYYIVSAMPSTDARGGQKMYVNNDGAMQFQNAETLGNVFQFVPAGDNAFYLYNVERGTYLNTAKGHNGGQATAVATTGSVKVSVANMGRENAVSIIPNGGAMLHAQAAGSQVVAWNNTDNAGASAWRISEVANITEHSHEITIGEAGYATLCLGYNAAIPTFEGEDCGVFTAAVVDGYAAMTKVEGVLPANTAVIVKAAGTYYFKYATGEAATIENNELKGTTINANITEDAYVLGYINVAEEGEEERKEVGLYTATKNKLNDTAWLNNAFKAYLPKSASSSAGYYSFRFGEGTTGIENVESAEAVKAIFDLTGRRVSEITSPGIYIVNGKKVIVK